MRRAAPLAFLVALLPLSAVLAQKADRKPLAVEDLYHFDGPQSVVVAPDGKSGCYVRHWLEPAKRAERFSLWRVEGSPDKVRPAEPGQPDARAPVYSPDGKWVAFLSTRPRPEGWQQTPPAPPQSDPATDVWLLPISGGSAIPLAGPKKPYGRVFNDGFYGRLAFSPDGHSLAFVADDGADPRTPEEVRNDVMIVRDDQGEGYTGYGPAQVWVARLDEKPGTHAASRIERLTKDEVWYGDPQWSPDGKTIVVHANRTPERESVRYSINRNFDLWAIDVPGGKLRQLTRGAGPQVSPRFSPDGKTLACLSIPRKGSHRDVFNLALVSLEKDEPALRVLFDHHAKEGPRASHLPPVFPLPEDCWDGPDHLVYTAEVGTRTQMVRVDVRTGRGEVLDLSVKGAKEAKPGSVASRLLRKRELTPPGNLFLRQRLLGRSEVITWKNPDGNEVEGILTRPPEGVGKAPYPLVVHPHGGPHSRSALGFDFTVQVLAGAGYAVLQPNFRGSSGYGQKFIDADRSDFGGGDMADILSGVDALVKKGVADNDRLFVYGVSYRGCCNCTTRRRSRPRPDVHRGRPEGRLILARPAGRPIQ